MNRLKKTLISLAVAAAVTGAVLPVVADVVRPASGASLGLLDRHRPTPPQSNDVIL
ncbi:hypothetical protein ACWC9R_35380 [Streptomyces sp. NPDC001219]